MKVLIVSHNPINKNDNNGITLYSLFHFFNKEDVAQVFFRDGAIDNDVCDSYFKITEFDIVKSLLKFKAPGEIPVYSENSVNENVIKNSNVQKSAMVKLARNLIWEIGTWKSNKFKKWLKGINPDLIFFYGSDYVFSQKIARWIKEYLNIPMVSYWVDDFYTNLEYSSNLIKNYNIYTFKKIFKKNINSSTNICITNKMAKEYSVLFNKEFYVMYTSYNNKTLEKRNYSYPFIISYIGNISLGRAKTLSTLGSIIKESDLPFILNVYSGEYRNDILKDIEGKDGINFKGKIAYSEVANTMNNSNFVLHVEGFEEENIKRVKFSFSTKIADSLNSGRCLLAFGPSEVASMEFLKDNNCALIANSKEEMKELLFNIVSNPNIIDETVSNALQTSKEFNNNFNNYKKLNNIFEKVVNR